MHRRSFLVTLGSLVLGSGLTSCQNRDAQILRLLALKGSIPSQLLGGFSNLFQPNITKGSIPSQLLSGFSKLFQPNITKVELAGEGQFKEILTQLEEWHKTRTAEAKGFKIPLVPSDRSAEYIPNLVSLGDAWLTTAIEQKLIQPIDINQLTNWSKLDSRWREIAQRDDRGNNSANGKIWGVPYRWGTTVIIYRRDKFAAANIPIPTDWGDLWNPQLRQRISLLDRSREVIGLTLKKLGYSYNYPDLSQAKNLQVDLEKIHQQVKFYSSDNYLQPLIMGDTWAAVGWSGDAIDLVQKNPNIGAIVPHSGTAIFADLWVQPAMSTQQVSPSRAKLSQQWIDYCLQTQVSNQISLLTATPTPFLTSLKPDQILPDIRKNLLILPPKSIVDRSEFIYPLSPTSKAQYDQQWQKIRQVKIYS